MVSLKVRYQPQLGFTLIELMIVVVIIGIIAAIAYPNFTEQVRKTRRSDGKVALTQMANQMEKYYSRCLDYNFGAIIGGGINACSGLGYADANSPEGYYALTLVGGATTYTITATAQNQQAADTKCPTLTLTSAGVKGPAGFEFCWN